MNQLSENEEAESRFQIFKYVYPDEDITTIDQNFFFLNSFQFSGIHRLRFKEYCQTLRQVEEENQESKLREREKELREKLALETEFKTKLEKELREREKELREREKELREREKELREKLEAKLELKYPLNIVNSIINSLPGILFRDENAVISKEDLINIIRDNSIFVGFDEEILKRECNRIYLCLYGSESSQDVEMDIYTPSFTVEGKILTIQQPSTEFFPYKFIYKRNCYEILLSSIINVLPKKPVVVIGDPGIGKSSFIQYIFSKMINESEKPKIFWELESGDWYYFDGVRVIFGSGDSEYWKPDNVLLLIDGKFRNRHLRKLNNTILFCSPQPQNYAKLIKKYNGAKFVMPTWNIEEINDFLREEDGSILCEIMGEFYLKTLERLDPEQKETYLNSRDMGQLNDNFEMLDMSLLRSIDQYDEIEAFKSKSKRLFLIENIGYRFKLVGGRIRVLLNNELNLKLLEKQVRNLTNSLSLEEIKHQECLELQRNVPSLVYSLRPNDIESDPRDYDICFASKYIADLVSVKMVYEYSKQMNLLFKSMKETRVGSSLVGQIFEALVIEAIVSKKLIDLKGRTLDEGYQGVDNFAINFSDFLCFDYDAEDKNLNSLLNNEVDLNQKNRFLTPIQSNAGAIDAIYYVANVGKAYFFQMTISEKHGFKSKFVKQLSKSLKIDPKNIAMVFLVPRDRYHEFKEQSILTAEDKVMVRVPAGFKQRVVCVPESVYSRID